MWPGHHQAQVTHEIHRVTVAFPQALEEYHARAQAEQHQNYPDMRRPLEIKATRQGERQRAKISRHDLQGGVQ